MTLVVPRRILAEMQEHGRDSYPYECCGFLLGAAEGETRKVHEARRQSNERSESRENRFLISPGQFRAAETRAKAAGLQMIGIYHSHPDSPARPSEYDREHAWPWFSYLILSVRKGKPAEAAVWRLRDDRAGYDEVSLEIGEET